MARSTTCDRCGGVIPNDTKPGKLSLVLVTNNPEVPNLTLPADDSAPDLCQKCVPQVFNYLVERVAVGALKGTPTSEVGRRKRSPKTEPVA